jgi:hypothetical protein
MIPLSPGAHLDVEQAVATAREFVKQNGYANARLESADEQPDSGKWVVAFDPLLFGNPILVVVTVEQGPAGVPRVVSFKRTPKFGRP